MAHLTAGLLYGREVKKPKWYTPSAKNGTNPAPSLPRGRNKEHVMEMLLTTDLDASQIAKVLRLNPQLGRVVDQSDLPESQRKEPRATPAAHPVDDAASGKAVG